MANKSWFDVVEGDELSQGDLFQSFPILVPSVDETQQLIAKVRELDIIAMTQSCDLDNKKIEIVQACPVWYLTDFANTNDYYKSRKGKEALRRGYEPGYHLLDKSHIDGFHDDFLVVDFRNACGVPFDFLSQLAQKQKQRISLQSPFREHLSQAFARFYMRVGLPADIPAFK